MLSLSTMSNEESAPTSPTLFFRAPKALVDRLDAYIAKSKIPEMTRPRAMRLILDEWLTRFEKK